MHPIRKIEDCRVVQVLGGLGNPSAEAHDGVAAAADGDV